MKTDSWDLDEIKDQLQGLRRHCIVRRDHSDSPGIWEKDILALSFAIALIEEKKKSPSSAATDDEHWKIYHPIIANFRREAQ